MPDVPSRFLRGSFRFERPFTCLFTRISFTLMRTEVSQNESGAALLMTHEQGAALWVRCVHPNQGTH